MVVSSRNIQQVLAAMDTVVARAVEKRVLISEEAFWNLLSEFWKKAGDARQIKEIRHRLDSVGMAEWDSVLLKRSGSAISEFDIWKWLEKWWPDPVQRVSPYPGSLVALAEQLPAADFAKLMASGHKLMAATGATAKRKKAARSSRKKKS